MIKQYHYINGYVLVYSPEHPRAFTSYESGHKGYVYEHIIVAERAIRRSLRKDEVVHHLDLIRSNNNPDNLLVMNETEHNKLHRWINRGVPILGRKRAIKGTRSDIKKHESKTHTQFKILDIRRCSVCSFPLSNDQVKTCSSVCSKEHNKAKYTFHKASITKEKLIRLKKKQNWSQIGRRYNVSDNAVRKWAKNFGLNPKEM